MCSHPASTVLKLTSHNALQRLYLYSCVWLPMHGRWTWLSLQLSLQSTLCYCTILGSLHSTHYDDVIYTLVISRPSAAVYHDIHICCVKDLLLAWFRANLARPGLLAALFFFLQMQVMLNSHCKFLPKPGRCLSLCGPRCFSCSTIASKLSAIIVLTTVDCQRSLWHCISRMALPLSLLSLPESFCCLVSSGCHDCCFVLHVMKTTKWWSKAQLKCTYICTYLYGNCRAATSAVTRHTRQAQEESKQFFADEEIVSLPLLVLCVIPQSSLPKMQARERELPVIFTLNRLLWTLFRQNVLRYCGISAWFFPEILMF